MKLNVFILGAGGFVGHHLVNYIIANPSLKVTILTRKSTPQVINGQRLDAINIDLLKPETLRGVFDNCDILVNLVYNRDASGEQNINMTQNLLNECQKVNIKKIIHVSTALVVGSIKGECLDENVKPSPDSEYKSAKLVIENMFISGLLSSQVIILRPTVVFGEGGLNLKDYIDRLVSETQLRGTLRASIVGKAPMNLIPVQTVVEAIIFFIRLERDCRGIYFVSQDDDPKNNMAVLDNIIYRELAIKQPLRFEGIPMIIRKLFMKLLRINIYKKATYSNVKMKSLGFNVFYDFEEAVIKFCKGLNNN